MKQLMMTMLKMNCIRTLRNCGFPYKCKANIARMIFTGIVLAVMALVILYIYLNEPRWAKENLLLSMSTNMHLIFIFMSIIGVVVAINWIRYEEYSEVKFLLSLPLQADHIYCYKAVSLFMESILFFLFVLSPFVMNIKSAVRIGGIAFIIVGSIMLGVGIGAQILKISGNKVKMLYIIIVAQLVVFSLGFKYTQFSFQYQNPIILYVAGILITLFSAKLIIKNFNELYILSTNKGKKKNDKKLIRCTYRAASEVTAFIKKDSISFFRNKRDLLKTIVMIGIILLVANLNGLNFNLPYAYIFPYILCNTWILDLAGQETYYYQINKLIYNGSIRSYYSKRLLSSALIVIPVCIVGGMIFDVLLGERNFIQSVSYILCLSTLEIFLSVGISILFKRESQSSYGAELGVNTSGQILYYILGAVYVFLFDVAISGKITALLCFGVAVICNIVINIINIIKKY